MDFVKCKTVCAILKNVKYGHDINQLLLSGARE